MGFDCVGDFDGFGWFVYYFFWVRLNCLNLCVFVCWYVLYSVVNMGFGLLFCMGRLLSDVIGRIFFVVDVSMILLVECSLILLILCVMN